MCVCVCVCVCARARARAFGCLWIRAFNCCFCFLLLSCGGSKMAHRSLKAEVNSSRSTFLSQLTAVNKVTPRKKKKKKKKKTEMCVCFLVCSLNCLKPWC